MKNLLKKLHIGSNNNQSEDSSQGGSANSSTKGNNNSTTRIRLRDGSSTPSDNRIVQSKSEHSNKPLAAISGWLSAVTNRNTSSNSSCPPSLRGERMEEPSDSVGSSSLDAALDAINRDSGSSRDRDRDVEEEYQIQMALEMSAREDPEAVQIEAVKQISLGSCHADNTPAEIVAYRYWIYNALSYDDKILDGFYDLYGILTESTSSKMPSLVDLQATPMADNISWEAVLVDRAADTKLLNLEQKAIEMALNIRSHSANSVNHLIVQKLATLVSEHMGGPVGDPDKMLVAWRNLSYNLKSNHGSMVLPLGSLTIGLARHRALLFKVLSDSLSIPCRLVKGQQFTGSDDVAMSFVKIDQERECIVDLMSDPGTLIPSDTAVAQDSACSSNHASEDVDSSPVGSSSGMTIGNTRSKFGENIPVKKISVDIGASRQHTGSENSGNVKKEPSRDYLNRQGHPYSHARSPSWTEGVSSPAVRRMKVKDVSQYMIDAAKENPQLAQKLHDVLLESGVVAPPNLFTEMYPDQLDVTIMDARPQAQENEKKVTDRSFLPPLPHQGFHSRGNPDKHSQSQLNSSESEIDPPKFSKNLPVAAAAAAAAAVVASSMVVAATKASNDSKLQLPVAAAATATAAAVVATTAAVSKQYENLEGGAHSPDSPAGFFNPLEYVRSDGEADGSANERESSHREHEPVGASSEGERRSDRSTGGESSKSDVILDDVADCEIPWEEITIGERIGLGSYGEVYRGDWHGTEVAVKKFLDQEITGESLEEFKSEVLIMRRVRHPNVVLFMGAVTRPPNLSIVTEFLPRGSLYRLLHRPNNQLDERRRLRMALDAARGMNYLHNCTPMIVHRDLKSPNLLVDKNWVVKVCDFGLSRMKHSTFLSSRSTAGTAEWMAPEVLRNEPSNEKCDVFSFGVILWELCTMQQPWGGLNPMQVVGAVGFQHRRLDIPDNVDPVIADIIRRCWETDPKLRPSFAEIMAALKPLQKPITSSQSRPSKVRSSASLEGSGDRKS